ncbi:MAG: hypothetical protein AAF713_02675 [Pseudomonadota bacterium]
MTDATSGAGSVTNGLGTSVDTYNDGMDSTQSSAIDDISSMDASTDIDALKSTLISTTEASLANNLFLKAYGAATDMCQQFIKDIRAKQ